jgi:hypothetical protein
MEKSIRLLERHRDLDACLIYNDESGAYKVFFTRGMKKLVIKEQ